MEQRGACRHCQAQCRCASKRLEEGQADPHARAHKTRSQEGRPCVACGHKRQRAACRPIWPSTYRVAHMCRCHCVARAAGCAPVDQIVRTCACYYGYHLRAGPQIAVHAPKGMGAKKPPKPAAAAPGSAAVVIKQRSFMAGATQATVAVQNRNLGCAAPRQLSELSTNWGSAVRWPV